MMPQNPPKLSFWIVKIYDVWLIHGLRHTHPCHIIPFGRVPMKTTNNTCPSAGPTVPLLAGQGHINGSEDVGAQLAVRDSRRSGSRLRGVGLIHG